jgi:hypothetical protein
MNRFLGYALLLASLSVPAFAAKNSQSVRLANPIKVGSTELPAGNYKVSWTGSASNVQVTIAEKGKASVTVPAKLVDAKNGHVALITNSVDGAAVLESIQLDNLSLMLTGAAGAGE